MEDMRTLRPGFYSDFWYKSHEHGGLAWGAILRKLLGLTLFTRLPCSFFQEHVLQIVVSPKRPRQQGAFEYGPYGPYMDFLREIYGPYGPYMDCMSTRSSKWIIVQYFQVPGHPKGAFFSISRFPGHQNGLFSNISRFPEIQSEEIFIFTALIIPRIHVLHHRLQFQH